MDSPRFDLAGRSAVQMDNQGEAKYLQLEVELAEHPGWEFEVHGVFWELEHLKELE